MNSSMISSLLLPLLVFPLACSSDPAPRAPSGAAPTASTAARAAGTGAASASGPVRARPRLVVLIVVDQLAGDLPLRYHDAFAPDGGFRYLMDRGTWYTDAEQAYAFTETAVGHASLSTGAWPANHGIIGNSWFDTRTGKVVSSVQDATYPVIGGTTGGLPFDPTGGDPSVGASPRNILSTTFGDELVAATGGKARVVGVSYKDRAAIGLAGHAGKALWYTGGGTFASSTFYYPSGKLPDWATAFNTAHPLGPALFDPELSGATPPTDPTTGNIVVWARPPDLSSYIFGGFDNLTTWPTTSVPGMAIAYLAAPSLPPVAGPAVGFKANLPHTCTVEWYAGCLSITPAGDRLTLAFAKAAIEGEDLGSDTVTDLLGVGLSSTDFIGHWFSRSSLESEDNLRELDRALGAFFRYLDGRIGLDNVLIVLGADHGGPDFPETLQNYSFIPPSVTPPASEAVPNSVARVTDIALMCTAWSALAGQPVGSCTSKSATSLMAAVGISAFNFPYFYLDSTKLTTAQSRAKAEDDIGRALKGVAGVRFAIGSSALWDASSAAPSDLLDRIRRSQHPTRAGQVYVALDDQWQLQSSSNGPIPLQHGVSVASDTHIALGFAGSGVPAARVTREVGGVDVAATLALIAGTAPPSGLVGEPLPEVTGVFGY